MLLQWPGYFCHLLLHPSLCSIPIWTEAAVYRQYLLLSWSSPSDAVPDVTWMTLVLPAVPQNSSDTKILCASGQIQQTRAEDIPPPAANWTDWCRRDAPKGCLGQTTGGHKRTRRSDPFPPLRAAQWEGQGKAGGNPAIVLAQTCRRWTHENKFDPEQKRILLFNRKIDLHNHTICIPPNPSPSATSVNSHPQPSLTEQQQAQG